MRDFVADVAVLVGAEQPDRVALRGELARKRGEVPRRPAFGGSVLRAGTECDHRLRAREPQARECGGEIRPVDAKPRLRQRSLGRGAGFPGELRVALGHQRQALFVELVHEAEQPVAQFADEPDAQRNVGEVGDERRLEGVGQHDRLVVTALAQGAAQAPARPELELAVPERRIDDFADFRHAPEHRRGPLRRERVDDGPGALFFQARKERLGEQRVADPARRDDEDLRHERAQWPFGRWPL